MPAANTSCHITALFKHGPGLPLGPGARPPATAVAASRPWPCRWRPEPIDGFAAPTQVKDTLRPDVKVYVEWSNEVWHTGFAGRSPLGRGNDGALSTQQHAAGFAILSTSRGRGGFLWSARACHPGAATFELLLMAI